MSLDVGSIVAHLRELQRLIRAAVLASRSHAGLAEVSRDSSADTIYRLDALIEPIVEDYCRHWSRTLPMVVIAEGLEPETGRCFPEGLRSEDAAVRVILDPIDGTRGLMYDKRSAWSLAGVAANRGDATGLRDISAAVMTELPTSKMNASDVLFATRGGGAAGVREPLDAGASETDRAAPLPLRPSRATTLAHGFASVANFFPGTKVLASALMERIAESLLGPVDPSRAMIFDDQYISTGGQLHELIVGHDRFVADLRPLFYRLLPAGGGGLCVHPYDVCTVLIAEEAGVEITDGLGGPLDGPLDCTSSLAWAGFANATLRAQVEPVLLAFFRERGLDRHRGDRESP
jgi:fructose-1,6-bisphosphatase/inositol monophosphatase family enzyme